MTNAMVMQTHYHVKSTTREIARRCGTPIYEWENAKVIAKDRTTVRNITLKIRPKIWLNVRGFSCRIRELRCG
jgi:hypothetical protein